MALVCKKCGYKQYDDETIENMKKQFPDYAEHDIPYYCGACIGHMTEEEYRNMIKE